MSKDLNVATRKHTTTSDNTFRVGPILPRCCYPLLIHVRVYSFGGSMIAWASCLSTPFTGVPTREPIRSTRTPSSKYGYMILRSGSVLSRSDPLFAGGVAPTERRGPDACVRRAAVQGDAFFEIASSFAASQGNPSFKRIPCGLRLYQLT
jgi:hypothetical protein